MGSVLRDVFEEKLASILFLRPKTDWSRFIESNMFCWEHQLTSNSSECALGTPLVTEPVPESNYQRWFNITEKENYIIAKRSQLRCYTTNLGRLAPNVLIAFPLSSKSSFFPSPWIDCSIYA